MMKKCKTCTSCSSFDPIPLDLIIEILLRLPAKSTTRFRCVSKQWDSTIRTPSFTELFFPMSSSRPKLLFTCFKDGETFFFSSPQPQVSSPLAVSRHMSFPVCYPFGNCQPVRGLVCGLSQQCFNGRSVTTPYICNPSTGESLRIPRVRTRRKKVFSYLGYDPKGKQFKVLCMTHSRVELHLASEHQVLTLQVGKRMSWRMLHCDIPHTPDIYGLDVHDGTCMNGVLFYLANIYNNDGNTSYSNDIVCFDISSETFKCIRKDQGMQKDFGCRPALVNYKGKLAMLQPHGPYRQNQNTEIWVLEDVENQQWLKNIYVLSPGVRAAWMSIQQVHIRFVGMADTGEIVVSPVKMVDSVYLIYLNTEKNTITRVKVQGMKDFDKVCPYLDYVEDLKTMAT